MLNTVSFDTENRVTSLTFLTPCEHKLSCAETLQQSCREHDLAWADLKLHFKRIINCVHFSNQVMGWWRRRMGKWKRKWTGNVTTALMRMRMRQRLGHSLDLNQIQVTVVIAWDLTWCTVGNKMFCIQLRFIVLVTAMLETQCVLMCYNV